MIDIRIPSPRTSPARVVAGLAAALLGVSALVLVTPAPADAAARLSASSSLGGTTASGSGSTDFTVSGSGYQVVEGGFGGVYVAFGWVDGPGWGPSDGGATGRTYDYVPDEQSRSNQGFQAFVAFPGSSTSGEAQATMGSDGSFRVDLTVPGPEFTGASGGRVNCREVTCGFLTFGAHGVRNGANEVFTPVTFDAGGDGTTGPAPQTSETGEQEAGAVSGRASASTRSENDRPGSARGAGPRTRTGVSARVGSGPVSGGATPSSGPASGARAASGSGTDGVPATMPGGDASTVGALIEVDRKAARAGGVLPFAAAGFWPGEQVYVVLGDGDAALGPVPAGVDGEVAGVLQLPDHIEGGTHEIRAAGAGSGLEAVERFAIRSDIAPAATTTGLRDSAAWIFLALAALALLGVGAFVIHRRRGEPESTSEPGEADENAESDEPAPPFPHPAMAGHGDTDSASRHGFPLQEGDH